MRKILLLLLSALGPAAHAANWPDHPVLHAVRVSVPRVIDEEAHG